MSEFYIEANSFAAPFVSDTSTKWVEAETPTAALEKFAEEYDHPCGLFAARCYRDANARSKGEDHLAEWLCNHEIHRSELTKDLGSYSYLGHEPGRFKIDGKEHTIDDPKEGRVI